MTALNKQALRSREEFEEYYNETHAVKVTSQFKRFGYYVSPTMQKAWELWQKAQSSMQDELKSAEKRIAEHRKVLNSLAAVARRYLPDYDEHPEIQAADELLESAAGIGVKGE